MVEVLVSGGENGERGASKSRSRSRSSPVLYDSGELRARANRNLLEDVEGLSVSGSGGGRGEQIRADQSKLSSSKQAKPHRVTSWLLAGSRRRLLATVWQDKQQEAVTCPGDRRTSNEPANGKFPLPGEADQAERERGDIDMAMHFLGACPESPIAHRFISSLCSALGHRPGLSNFPRIRSVQGRLQSQGLAARVKPQGSIREFSVRWKYRKRHGPQAYIAQNNSLTLSVVSPPAPPPKQAKPAAGIANPETRWAPPSQLCREKA